MSLTEFPRIFAYTPPPSQWTVERIATARLMWINGHSASEIGIAIGSSRNAVIGKLNRLGLGANSRPAGTTLKYSQLAKVKNAKVGDWQGYPKPTVGKRNTPLPQGFRRRALPKNKAIPVYEPQMADIERSEAACTFAELSRDMCRWPYGDPGTPDFAFCGRHADGTYCAGHRAVAYRRPA